MSAMHGTVVDHLYCSHITNQATVSEPIENSLNINEIEVKDILLLQTSDHAALTKCGIDFIFLENC